MTTELPDADGEAIYPHSYERLGRQSGYHITVILYDPSPDQTRTRTVRLQVLCGPKYGKVSPPHLTLDMEASEKNVAVAKCPGKRLLIGGGYQRTNFTNTGGILATESRAISSKAWQVSGLGLGRFGGQMTSVGYCVRAKKPPLTAVSATAPVPPLSFASATTPSCPKGKRVAFGGFSSSATGIVLPDGGSFNGARRWRAGGYNTSRNETGSITAYGYCLNPDGALPVLSQRRDWAAWLVLAAALAAGLVAQAGAGPAGGREGKPVSKVRTWRTGGGIKVARQSFRMTQPDEKRRLVVRCPKRRFPLGGAMTASPPPGPDGEGVYPHSYERLGRQRGWHVTAVLYDPSRSSTADAAGHRPGRVRARPRPRHAAPHPCLCHAGPDADGDRQMPRPQAPLLRRLPAHGLHLPRRRLRHRGPRRRLEDLAGHRPRLRRVRRRADRDRLLHAQQAAAAA